MQPDRLEMGPREIMAAQRSGVNGELRNLLTIQILKVLINSKRGRIMPNYKFFIFSPQALYLTEEFGTENPSQITTVSQLEKSGLSFKKIRHESVLEINFSNTEKVKKRNTFAIKVVLKGEELMMIQTTRSDYFLLRNIFQSGLVLSKKNLCLGVGAVGRERLEKLDGYREVMKVFQYFVVDGGYMGVEEFMRVGFGEGVGDLMIRESRYGVGKRLNGGSGGDGDGKKGKGQMTLKFFVPDVWGLGKGLIRGDEENRDYAHNVGALALDKVFFSILMDLRDFLFKNSFSSSIQNLKNYLVGLKELN